MDHRNRWFSQLETSIYNGFSIAMLNYQRVKEITFICLNLLKGWLFVLGHVWNVPMDWEMLKFVQLCLHQRWLAPLLYIDSILIVCFNTRLYTHVHTIYIYIYVYYLHNICIIKYTYIYIYTEWYAHKWFNYSISPAGPALLKPPPPFFWVTHISVATDFPAKLAVEPATLPYCNEYGLR